MPWRLTHNPYAIWVSEVMLQQTQVQTVIPYFERFMQSFPTIESLADASEEEVLRHWSGLGYYSRARNLKRGAEYLLQLDGKFPKTLEELLNVPGIGPYTAGAILSIAFDLAVPIVDGNVQRVFARYYGLKLPVDHPKMKARFWKEATLWVEAANSPRILNQALMELGATVCSKSNPQCLRCPLSRTCIAYEKNLQALLPIPKARKQTTELYWAGLIFMRKDKIFLKQNGEGEWWSKLWDFPKMEITPINTSTELKTKLLKSYPSAQTITELGSSRHTVTHHKIQVRSYLIRELSMHQVNLQGRWVRARDLEKLPLSALAKKMLAVMPL